MNALILAPQFSLAPVTSASPAAIARKDEALAASALISSNKPLLTAAANQQCFDARRNIKDLARELEKERKRIADPVNDWLRTLKAAIDIPIQELDREAARLEELEKDFRRREDARIREEQEAAERERQRIEREAQAEIQRLAREQAAREAESKRIADEAARKVREAQEAAERQAREATNKAQREAAEKARKEAEASAQAQRVENERLAAASAEDAAQNAAAMARVQEQAGEAAALASAPVDRTRATGQIAKKVWKITQISDFQLLKARPDLVRRIEWDRAAITAALNAGEKLPGVTAEEDYSIGTRGRTTKTIDV